MEVFKTQEMKNEFEELKKLLPLVIECNYCRKKKCRYHSKFDISCILCKNAKCKNCFKFDISKNILMKSSSITVDFITNFISDFFNLSDLTLKEFFPEIKIEKREIVNYTTRVKSKKNRSQVVKSEISWKI